MSIPDLPKVMIISLTCTIILELIMALILKYRRKDLIYVILVNVLTNPLLNSITVTINYYYGLKYRNIILPILEIMAIVVEGYIYQKYLNRKKINGYILSLILNITSFVLGLLVNKIIY